MNTVDEIIASIMKMETKDELDKIGAALSMKRHEQMQGEAHERAARFEKQRSNVSYDVEWASYSIRRIASDIRDIDGTLRRAWDQGFHKYAVKDSQDDVVQLGEDIQKLTDDGVPDNHMESLQNWYNTLGECKKNLKNLNYDIAWYKG